MYADALLQVIAAPDHLAKGELLAQIEAPAEGATWPLPAVPARPGRPAHWLEASKPHRRRKGIDDPMGRLRFLHAIQQIELTAIDLACLLCLRAPGAPRALHADHLRIAREEARHAGLLHDYLVAHDYPPGSEAVHFRLWDSALAAEDIGEQLVVIPRFLEARGLDVTAELLPRMAKVDREAHRILTIIYEEEQGHVGIGTRWHRHWCAEQGLDPYAHFVAICRKHFPDQVPGPVELDRPGRTTAGFWPTELDFLETGEDAASG